MYRVGAINRDLRLKVWAELPNVLAKVNLDYNAALGNNDFNVTMPQELYTNFDTEIVTTTPYAFFDLSQIAGEDKSGLVVTTGFYIIFTDYANSNYNDEAYNRYCEAIYDAITTVRNKKPTYLSDFSAEWVPTNSAIIQGSTDKVAGCFVKYNLGMRR